MKISEAIKQLEDLKRFTNMQCFECEHGEYFKIKEDYHAFVKNKDVVVRDIEVLLCDSCGSKILGDKANKKIDKALEQYYNKEK